MVETTAPKFLERWPRQPNGHGQPFFNIVQKCGGKGLGIEDGNGRRIVVTGESSRNDLDIARCVQASTSVRFSAGVKEHGLGSVLFDQQPFRALWDDRS
ncbi:MAG: hypothetical protein ABW023_13470 [Sphingomonas sp.]